MSDKARCGRGCGRAEGMGGGGRAKKGTRFFFFLRKKKGGRYTGGEERGGGGEGRLELGGSDVSGFGVRVEEERK